MQSLDPGKAAGVVGGTSGRVLSPFGHSSRGRFIPMLASACLLVSVATASPAWAQAPSNDNGFSIVTRRTNDPFTRINEALQRYGRIFLWVGVGLSAVVAIKIVGPVQIYYGMQDSRLRRAVRPIDELLKRIGKEAETTSETAKEEETPAENGVLAGMMEIAEFEQAEQTPSYVPTVNDMMLDNIGLTLKRLRRFHDGSAEKYQDNLFTVIHGIQTITQHSEEAGVPSGLAVDVAEYFRDDHRYKIWRRTLSHWTSRGKHQETAAAFLSFMRTVREDRPAAASKSAAMSMGDTAVTTAVQEPSVPNVLNEETLPAVQEAAAEEARNLLTLIEAGSPATRAARWQFELVRRQQQIHLRNEAQRTLSVFLKEQRKALQAITKIKMLPCRTWGHVLYMLGVDNTAHLHRRIDDRLLAAQEIIILEKAFLQTLAKREVLVRIYGQGQQAGLMVDEHVPEIRREALALIQRLQQTEPDRLAAATETLNEEETPRNGLVKRLLEHYKK